MGCRKHATTLGCQPPTECGCKAQPGNPKMVAPQARSTRPSSAHSHATYSGTYNQTMNSMHTPQC